tara:strand:+ start:1144 stop:2169 length:1026 start_codon:yes stop_codon:yes gene_type:complete
MEVNLISDTVTLPSEGMLDAINKAKIGDDVYKEDPSINELEEKVAKLFNKEDALFFPSGTMANQTAIKIHTSPGEQLICDHYSHVFNYEGGGVSFNSGVSCNLIEGNRGMINSDQIISKINPPDFYHSPLTSLVCLENSTNKGGGAVYAINEIEKIKAVCKENNLGLHLDGARIWNAIIASKTNPSQYGPLFDSISVCFSKGLGAPVGSALISSKEFIQKALRIRKVLGGGMRQSGILAAAASYAIDNHWTDLEEDHFKAKDLEKELIKLSFIKKVEHVETNIVIFELINDIDNRLLLEILNKKGIRISDMGNNRLRIVTHRDYTKKQHDYVLAVLSSLKF